MFTSLQNRRKMLDAKLIYLKSIDADPEIIQELQTEISGVLLDIMHHINEMEKN